MVSSLCNIFGTSSEYWQEKKNRAKARILIAGCGNSSMASELHADGWTTITNIDYSPSVIAQMKELHASKPEIEWVVADLRELPSFERSTFHVVIDKATLDAISCGPEGSVQKAVSEIHRILHQHGCYLILTYSKFKIDYFMDENNITRDGNQVSAQDNNWNITSHTVTSLEDDDNGSVTCPSNIHFLFTCLKR